MAGQPHAGVLQLTAIIKPTGGEDRASRGQWLV